MKHEPSRHMHQLLHKEWQLQTEAQVLLRRTQLLTLLAKYGVPRVNGSLSSGLMTRREIDLELSPIPTRLQLSTITGQVSQTIGLSILRTRDYRQ